MFATKDELFEELKLSVETVTLNSGKVIIVSEITAPAYMEMCKICAIGDMENDADDGAIKLDMNKFNGALLAYCLVDESGNRIFSDDDIPQLINSAHGALTEMVEVAKRLNGFAGTEENASEPTEDGSSTGE